MTKKNDFLDFLKKEVLVLDGATGTMLQKLDIPEIFFGGKNFAAFGDLLNFSKPEIVEKLHIDYFLAAVIGHSSNPFRTEPIL